MRFKFLLRSFPMSFLGKDRLRAQVGTSLVSLLVGIALTSIVSFFLGNMLVNSLRSRNNIHLKNEVLEFKSNLEIIHDCSQTLQNLPADCTTPVTVDIYNRAGNVLISSAHYTKVTPKFYALATCLEDHVDATGAIDFPGRYIKISMAVLKPGVITKAPTANDLEKDSLTGLPTQIDDLYQTIPFSCMYGQNNLNMSSPSPSGNPSNSNSGN